MRNSRWRAISAQNKSPRSYRRAVKGGLSVVAVVCVSVLVAGCSSSGKSGGASDTSSATPAAGSPIGVASINTETGAGNLKPMADGFAAFTAYVNAQGGIDGHPLVQHRCDTDNDAQLAATCSRNAVDDKLIIVAAGGEEKFAPSVMGTLAAATDPMGYICPGPVVTSENSAPNSFCLGAGTGISFYLDTKYAQDQYHVKSSAMITGDTTDGHNTGAFFAKQAEALGVKLSQTYFSPTTPDFLPVVQGVLAQKPDYIWLGAAPTQEAQVLQALVTLGSTVPVGTLASLVPVTTTREIASADYPLIFDSSLPDISTSSDPEIAIYKTWMQKQGLSDSIGPLSLQGWLSGRVVQKAIEQIGADKVTRANMMALLRTGTIKDVPLMPATLGLIDAPKQTPGLTSCANPSAYVAVMKKGVTTVTDTKVTLP
jgi:branched-chain amino acid transport system substrate-binding protein